MTRIGILWDSEVSWQGEKPFSYKTLNPAYELFGEYATQQGAEIAVAKFNWVKGDMMENCFVFRDGSWLKKNNVDFDVVFDKFKYDEETLGLKKELNSSFPVLNVLELEELCKDKLESYRRFPEYVPETRKATRNNVRELLEDGKAVLKPRYDFGGEGVQVIDDISDFDPEADLVQRFVESGRIPGTGIEGVHDLRFYVLNGSIEMAYVRQPEEGFISNLQQGGTAEVVDTANIPDRVIKMVGDIADEVEGYSPSFYSVDTILDREGNPHVLELNSKPGLAFHGNKELENAKRPLIRKVVRSLVEMS